MTYRPEGMEKNPYTNHGAVLKEMGNEIAWEAGANAMLEGLKKEAWNRIVPGNYVETNADGYKYHEPDITGYLVFIPESSSNDGT